MLHHTCSFAAAIGLALGASLAQAQATPAGLWKTIDDETKQEKSLVRITDEGGVYTGRIERLLDPSMGPERVCEKCSDDRKGQPLVGMTLIKGIKRSDGDKVQFDGGEILDPNNGKTYKARLTPVDGGRRLDVRGYIGTPLLGRTQTWIRVE